MRSFMWNASHWILPGMGRETSRRLAEGALHQRLTRPMASSTTPLRVAVPLPVAGRIE